MHRQREQIWQLVLLIPCLALLAGCAVGQKYSLDQAQFQLTGKGSGALALAVQDSREYVVSGRNEPALAGIIRGGWGNPFYVTTSSAQPLATDMAAALTNSLKSKGYEVESITVTPQQDDAAVIALLTAAGAKRLLHLKLTEWKPDLGPGGGLSLLYGFVLTVRSDQGVLLATEEVQGSDDLGTVRGMGFMPIYEEKVRQAFAAKMNQLFATASVQKAMN